MLSLLISIVVVIILLAIAISIIGAFIGILGFILSLIIPVAGFVLAVWFILWLFELVTGRKVFNNHRSSFDNEWYVIDKRRGRRYRERQHDDKWSDF